MNRFLPFLCLVAGTLLASQCLGQCHHGGMRSFSRPSAVAISYPTRGGQPAAPNRLRRPSLKSTLPSSPGVTATDSTSGMLTNRNRVLPKSTARNAASQSQPIPARKIQSTRNGAVLQIAMKTNPWPAGKAILNIDGMSLMLEPQRWEPGWVQIELPRLLLEKKIQARLFIAANPETVLEELRFTINP